MLHRPRTRRGMTMTELLVVVSVITILTTMMSPVLLRVQQEGYRAKCTANLKQINLALATVANQQNGKLPKCFDLKDPNAANSNPDENSWWYRKVARVAYPTDAGYDYLSVPRSDHDFWNNYDGPLKKFNPDSCILRCPTTTDHYDERDSTWHESPLCVYKRGQSQHIDKDRVYDDCYGYNNTGFDYSYGNTSPLWPQQDNPIGRSKLYHWYQGGNNGTIAGSYDNYDGDGDGEDDFTYIGWLSDIPQAAQTILIMDYLKADAAPDSDPKTVYGELRDGYRFRHGGKANILFVDGHVEGYRERIFRPSLGDGTIHWSVKIHP